ncbi:hypothetical protein MTO96_029672 [Rhipicephalus appendiculatus]
MAARNRTILRNLAIFTLLSALNCGGPVHCFDATPPRHPADRQGRASSSGNNSQRPPRLPPHIPLLHPQYRHISAPPRWASLQGQPPARPYNPVQGFFVSPETRHLHGARAVSHVPPAGHPGQPFGNSATGHAHDEEGRKEKKRHDYLHRRWFREHALYYQQVKKYGEPALRGSSEPVPTYTLLSSLLFVVITAICLHIVFSTKYYDGALSFADKPPRFSQARHPRAQNTHMPEEQPAVIPATQGIDADR